MLPWVKVKERISNSGDESARRMARTSSTPGIGRLVVL